MYKRQLQGALKYRLQMGGETDMPDLSRLFRLHECIQRASLGQHLVQPRRSRIVHLIKIALVGF